MGTSSRIVIPSTSPGLFLSRFSLEMAGKQGWRDGEDVMEVDKAGLCSCYNTIPIVCLSFSWLAKKRRRSRRSEEVCLLPRHPPRHTVAPAQVEPADPKEKGGRGFTRRKRGGGGSQEGKGGAGVHEGTRRFLPLSTQLSFVGSDS